MKFFCLIILLLLIGCQACRESEQEANNSPVSSTIETLFQEAQVIAADLDAPRKLIYKYHNLTARVGVTPGNNLNSTFIGIKGIKNALRNRPAAGDGDLNKFIKWAKTGNWEQFGPNYHHYDWWMFPIDRTSSQGLKYTVYQNDIQQLQSDLAWLKDYRLGAILLIQSWGWDVKNKKVYSNPAPGQSWRNWDVRLGKLANSLILFEQWDLYDSLKDYVNSLIQSGVKIEQWVLKYFPDK
jgi:hypothetical protein